MSSNSQHSSSTGDRRSHGAARRSDDDHAVRIALLEQGMDSIKIQLKGINDNMSKLVWLVLSALILAVIKLVLTGG